MFTVMTWNVENLFQPEPSAQADFDAKLDALAGVVTAAGPDLLAVQEVGDEVAFDGMDDISRRLGARAAVLQTHVRHDGHAWSAHLVRRQAGRQAESRQGWIMRIDMEKVERLDPHCRGQLRHEARTRTLEAELPHTDPCRARQLKAFGEVIAGQPGGLARGLQSIASK